MRYRAHCSKVFLQVIMHDMTTWCMLTSAWSAGMMFTVVLACKHVSWLSEVDGNVTSFEEIWRFLSSWWVRRFNICWDSINTLKVNLVVVLKIKSEDQQSHNQLSENHEHVCDIWTDLFSRSWDRSQQLLLTDTISVTCVDHRAAKAPKHIFLAKWQTKTQWNEK